MGSLRYAWAKSEVDLGDIVTSSMEEKEEQGCFRVRMIEFHDYRTLLGPCMISFSIPLLIPGVVLTVVGSYGNEHTFPTFGGWHITGIVILTFSTSLLLLGIVLKCIFRPFLSPEITQHLTPTHSVNSGHHNLGFEAENIKEKTKKVYKKSDKDNLNAQIERQLHRVVSTHEVRDQPPPDSAMQLNGDIAQGKEHRKHTKQHKQTNKVTHQDTVEEEYQDVKTEAVTEDEGVEKKSKKRHSKRSKRSEEISEDGMIKTAVTTSIDADVDTTVVVSNEDRTASQQDYEEKRKRRKKKKRRRQKAEAERAAAEGHVTLSDGETRNELPDVRATQPHTPPNVPDRSQLYNETTHDLLTPRPIDSSQHVPVRFENNTNLDAQQSSQSHQELSLDTTRLYEHAPSNHSHNLNLETSERHDQLHHVHFQNEPKLESNISHVNIDTQQETNLNESNVNTKDNVNAHTDKDTIKGIAYHDRVHYRNVQERDRRYTEDESNIQDFSDDDSETELPPSGENVTYEPVTFM